LALVAFEAHVRQSGRLDNKGTASFATNISHKNSIRNPRGLFRYWR
jgi:hypothetical protein